MTSRLFYSLLFLPYSKRLLATLADRTVTVTFTGLVSTAVTAIVFLIVGFTLEDSLKRLRRYPDEDKRRAAGDPTVHPDRGMEGWAMGYLYRARTYVPVNPAPDYGNWPLGWIWQAIKLEQKFYETHCGPDATVYVRFLRGALYWTFGVACTVFPILTALNWTYSPESISRSSIDRASLSSIALSATGSHLLYVHVICLWLTTFSWFATLTWIGYGALRIRRNQDPGWRFRSVLVFNIPDSMRSELALREYFTSHLAGPAADLEDDGKRRPVVEEIVLVRKQAELNELWDKYREVLGQLETAHVELAEHAVAWVRTQIAVRPRVVDDEGHAETKEVKEHLGVTPAVSWSNRLSTLIHRRRKPAKDWALGDVEGSARAGDVLLLAALGPYAEETSTPPSTSIWETFQKLDPLLLDRFQPLWRLRHFRGQAVPSIDYHLTKLNLLAALIEHKRTNLDPPASSAFVTFSSAALARRARIELKSKPGGTKLGRGVFECRVQRAPEARDLNWSKICRVSLSGDLVRGAVFQVAIWAATIFWVLPLSFLVGLLSLSSLAKYIPSLSTYLAAHAVTLSLFSNLLPTSIVALLGMLVPTLISMLTRNGQIFVTVSKLDAAVMARYWKWMMVNFILVFCIGVSAFTAFLNAFKQPTSVLTVIANAFPQGATFFVSWALLIIGVHHGVQSALFGIPYINHGSIRKLKSPRKRELEALPRSFSYFYWIPNHLTVLSVVFIFVILNPMVVPFVLAYLSCSICVFKNQFAHVYWRRWYEGNGRLVFRRLFRYSLDSWMVAQVVALALFEVLKYYRLGGAIIPLIPITAFVKLIGTRWFDSLMDEIDEVEAELVCGHREGIQAEALDLSVPLNPVDEDFRKLSWRQRFSSIWSFATHLDSTLPALTFHPQNPLPVISSPSNLTTAANGTSIPLRQPIGSRRPSNARMPTSSQDDIIPTLSRPSQESMASTHHDVRALSSAVDAKEGPKKERWLSDALITPHALIVRDDRPVSHLKYGNPAEVEPLARGLWLPRDPLVPLDLGDTVDYWGRMLISSEGGKGEIGDWEKEDEAQEGEVEGRGKKARREATVVEQVGAATPAKHDGTERILVASEVAARSEVEGGMRPGIGRRRGTGGSSLSAGSIRPPFMPRRGTGASTLGRGSVVGSPAPTPSPGLLDPRDSPVRHARPSPPMASFTAEPEAVADDATFFPPPPTVRTTSDGSQVGVVQRPQSGHVRQQRSSSLSLLPRRGRSPSMQVSIAEAPEAEAEEEVFVSQADALRGEVVEEERREHAKRVEREQKERKEERSSWESRWLTRLFVRQVEDEGET